jgi:lysophospholipase L1-like esterase
MLASVKGRVRKMRSVCVLAVIAGALIAPAAQAGAAGPKVVPPKDDYLALGDSLAFGFQQAKFNALFPNEDPAAFNTGYVDDFAAALAPISPAITTVNYSCPGEWTDSFLGSAPCPYSPPFALHDPYTGSQMTAADSFLTAHSNQTSPVTIDIGGNDVLHVVSACTTNPAPYPDTLSCVTGNFPATAAHIVQNLSTILGHLRADAPKTEIIVVGLYNVLVVRFGPASDLLAAQLNSAMANTAAAFDARFADPLPVFNPPGPNEIPTICTLTAVCGPLHDIHPTDVGYQALANVVFAASGYGRLAG